MINWNISSDLRMKMEIILQIENNESNLIKMKLGEDEKTLITFLDNRNDQENSLENLNLNNI